MTLVGLPGGQHPSRLELEDWFFASDGSFDNEGRRSGGGPGLDAGRSELDGIGSHLHSCDDCQATVDTLRDARTAFLEAAPKLPPLPSLAPSKPPRRWGLLAVAAAVLLSISGLWWAGAPDDADLGVRPKGAAQLVTLVEQGGAWVSADSEPQPGQVVRFRASLPESGHPLVLSVQDDGARGLLLPLPTQPMGAGVVELAGATRLDDYGGGETVELWLSPVPWDAIATEALLAGRVPAGASLIATTDLRGK